MITKQANTPPWWPKIESGLRGGVSNLPANIRALLEAGKITHHATPPEGVAPNAKAFVTTEDADDDGKLDSVHMVISNIEREIPPDVLSRINQMELSDPALQSVLTNIAKTLAHEVAHLDDHTFIAGVTDDEPGVTRNPEHAFPGGEAVAESREQSFNPIFARTTTNKKISNDNKAEVKLARGYIVKEELVKLANHLDRLGRRGLADRLDDMLRTANSNDAYQTSPKDTSRSFELPIAEVVEELPEEIGDKVNDFAISAESSQDRINKMAELMAGELTSNVPEFYIG